MLNRAVYLLTFAAMSSLAAIAIAGFVLAHMGGI